MHQDIWCEEMFGHACILKNHFNVTSYKVIMAAVRGNLHEFFFRTKKYMILSL